MTGPKTLVPPADLDRIAAISFFEGRASPVGSDIIVDGAQVERIDRLYLHFRLAAISTWKLDEVVLEFTNRSFGLVVGLERLGIGPEYF